MIFPSNNIPDQKRRRQRGAILVMTALLSTALIAVSVLSTGVGLAFVQRTQARNAADLGSLAAIKRFAKTTGGTIDVDAIRAAAAVTARENSTIDNAAVTINTSPVTDPDDPDGDITFGYYDHTARSFTGYADSHLGEADVIVNAVRTRVRMGAGGNQPITVRLAGFLGNAVQTTFNTESESVASFAPIRGVFALDQSASMDNRTYKTTEVCRDSTKTSTSSRWFHYAATSAAYGDCENTVEADYVFGPGDPNYGNHVMPQPITDVLEAIDVDLLEGNRLFRTLVQMGLLVFASQAFTPYSPGDPVNLTAATRNNKEAIQQTLRYSLGEWSTYTTEDSNTRDFTTFPEHMIFPGSVLGGNNEQLTATNIGDALHMAVDWIRGAEAGSQTSNTKFIVMFSDGAPNCARIGTPASVNMAVDPICPDEADIRTLVQAQVRAFETQLKNDYGDPLPPEQQAVLRDYRNLMRQNADQAYIDAAKAWSLANADYAHDNDVTIYSIYFATDEGVCDPENHAEGFTHLQEVSARTGGQAYCADNAAGLATIFNNLSTQQNFVLVHTD